MKAINSPYQATNKTINEESLIELLSPKGQSRNIGEESGRTYQNGISRFVNPYGSYRYVLFKQGEAVSAIQVMSRDGIHGRVANVFTKPEHQKQGFATLLFYRAEQDFKTIKHSDDLTLAGAKFANSTLKVNTKPHVKNNNRTDSTAKQLHSRPKF